MDWIFLILALISGLLFSAGDIFLKYWSMKSNIYLIIIAFIFYILAGTVLALSFKRKDIAVAVAALICFNLMTVALLGFLLFKEVLGLKDMVGITFALIAIIILAT